MKLIIVDGGDVIINAETVTGIEKERRTLLNGAESKVVRHSLIVHTGCGENVKSYCIGDYTNSKICNAAMYELSRFLTSDGDTTFRAFNDEDFMENFPETKILD